MRVVLAASAVSSTTPPWALWLAALVGLGFLVFAVIRHARRVVRSGNDVPSSELQTRWQRAQGTGAAPANEAGLTGAVQAAADHLDRRTAELDRLVRLADQRIAELRRLTEARPGATDAGAPVFGDPAGPADRVYALADAGKSARQIAEETGQPLAAVSLTLALRR